MLKKILALYDRSKPSEIALEWALRWGEHFHSDLKVLHALTHEERAPSGEILRISQEILDQIRREIDLKVRELSAKGEKGALGRLEIDVFEGRAVPTLLKTIAEEGPDLVVQGTQGRTGLDHVLLGSVAEKIVRHSPAPVFTTRGPIAWLPKSVLIPVDFSDGEDLAQDSLEMAGQLSQTMPLKIELLHVLNMSDLVKDFPQSLIGKEWVDKEKLEEKTFQKLNALIKKFPKLKISPSVRIGPVSDEICKAAKELDVDLILIPTHGRTGWEHFFIGSVTEHVVRYAHCNVLSYCPKSARAFRQKTLEAHL